MESTRIVIGMAPPPYILPFGITNGRPPHRRFGIKAADRLLHLYIIGRTGTGKSTLLYTMAREDMARGRGLIVIDPHGDLATHLVSSLPPERTDDLIYLDVPDPHTHYGYNPLRGVRPALVPLAVSGLMEAFKMLWGDAWGVRMEHVLRNALFALIEAGNATLPDILRLFVDREFRKAVVSRVHNAQVHTFWATEWKDYHPRYRQEAIAPIQNKVGAFLADLRLFRIFTEAPIDLHFRRIMDDGKILIVNLAKGRLGDDSARLFGALLMTTLGLAGLSRADQPDELRKDCFLYVDEFQSFTTLSVAAMISELRKFHVGLTLAHQHLYQLSPEVRHAVLGNVGSLIAFRLGAEDAQVIAREFEGVFAPLDFMRLPNHDIYVSLAIDGVPGRPLSATTLPA